MDTINIVESRLIFLPKPDDAQSLLDLHIFL